MRHRTGVSRLLGLTGDSPCEVFVAFQDGGQFPGCGLIRLLVPLGLLLHGAGLVGQFNLASKVWSTGQHSSGRCRIVSDVVPPTG